MRVLAAALFFTLASTAAAETVLIRDGRVDYKMLKRESISKNDLMASLREHGCMSPHEVEWAVLETSGRITVKQRGGAG